MTKMWRTIAATLLLSTATISVAQTSPVAGTAPAATSDVTATLHADASGPVYDRRIFTQFAEHLGNGIYGGLWVGKNSRIPNTRGFRNDVVAALKQLGVPVVRWPGGALPTNITGGKGSAPNARSRSTPPGAASPSRTKWARMNSWT